MGLFNHWPAIRRIVQLVIIQLFCWLACSVSFCFAQSGISEGVTGSVNFPSSLAITCVGNLAVFVATLIRGRLDLEIGARDALGILLGRKLRVIIEHNDRYALTTREVSLQRVDVVMLSNGRPNSSVREFMKSRAPIVDSILLQFQRSRERSNVPRCPCTVRCRCIVFWADADIRGMLAGRMPGTLIELARDHCLLPCLDCLKNGCHGRVANRAEPHAFCTILQDDNVDISICTGEPLCICIPLNDAKSDMWTELLMRSFRSKDAEGRGVKVNASEVLESYLAGGRGNRTGTVEYSIASFILPRLTEALINIVLTGLFKVDGFSSSLAARRTVRDYIVDSKGSGFAANAFLTKALVTCDANSTCQLLTFRGNVLSIRTIAIAVGCVNLGCSIVWAVLIAFDGGADASPPPSMPRVAVIYVAIGIALAMNYRALSEMNSRDFRTCICPWLIQCMPRARRYGIYQFLSMTAIHTEMMFVMFCGAWVAAFGSKGFGNWLYSAVQILVFLKWMAGCYILDLEIWREFFGSTPPTWVSLPYSSAFLLNGALAGVRATWGPWPWKDNHLWSRKHLH